MRAVNLIPPDLRRGSSSVGRSGGAVYVLLGALGGLMILAALYAVADHQVSDRQAQLAQANRRSVAATQRTQQLTAYKQFADLRAQREVQIVGLASGRFDWPGAMHDLAAALPAGVHLSTFDASLPSSGSSGSPAPASPAPAPAPAAGASTAGVGGMPTAHLTGCATSQTEVGDVINRLRGIPSVSAVSFASSSKGSATPGAGAAPPAAAGTDPSCGATAAQFDVTVFYKPAAPRVSGPASPGQPAGAAVPPASPAQPASATPSATPAPGGHP